MSDTTGMFEKILLIEDEEAHVFLIERALKKLGSMIDTAGSVAAGITLLAEQQYDLVISDLNLPDSTAGLSIKRVIEAAAATPVIVLTSSRLLSDAVEAMQYGARDFLVKDFDSSFQEVLTLALSRLYTTAELAREKIRLQQEMAILRVAIENSTDAMAIVNRKAEVLYTNKTFVEFSRRCAAENDMELNAIFTEAVVRAPALKETVLSRIATLPAGAHWSTELQLAEHRDAAFDFTVSIIPGASPEQTAASVIWIRDISEQKRREDFQRKILSTTSHDLKGPLAAISLSAELISEMTETEEKPHQLAIRILSSARGAINLIDEFLSAGRIQEGNFILKPERQAIEPLLVAIKKDYGSLAVPRAITLTLDVAPDTSGTVDAMGFTRTIGNLLTNALKFTDKNGTVTISARSTAEDLVVSVQDTGSGMEPAEVLKIFERFGRLERHREVDGTGIGLFVVKSIVTAHGGQIEVTSKPDEGTIFQLNFPHAPPVNERGELISLDF